MERDRRFETEGRDLSIEKQQLEEANKKISEMLVETAERFIRIHEVSHQKMENNKQRIEEIIFTLNEIKGR